MKRYVFQIMLIALFPVALLAQPSVSPDEDFLPKDYLPASFHAGRRTVLRDSMPANSVAVIFAYPTRTFSNDVDYIFHQNPDMYYFSGYKEPHSMLLIFKDEQTDSAGGKYTELLFVQRKDPRMEQWTGKRMGIEGVQKKLGIRMALNGDAFKSYNIDFSKFDKVLFDGFPIDVPNSPRDNADLYDLIKAFKEKAAIPDDYAKEKRFDRATYRSITAKLREIKTEEEMVLLRKAIEISCQAHNEVMKAIHPNMSELEIQGLQEFIHKKQGAENIGYGSIVGAGENGCVLHYVENNKTKIGNSMLLMDVGAEYHGYTADVTRTVPANGKFSDADKAIYQLVYDAQEAAFARLKHGCTWREIDSAARATITAGLIKLGVAKNVEEANQYYPHGLGHHIGLDVHDRGTYNELKKGMVITIEPGIYIPSNSKCDKKWWGIAVRIEDDALVTQNGYELLTQSSPRKIEDIEKMIAEKSALDDLKLPPLKSAEKKRGF
jgi:Xaa-Pro aminopeptidase